MPLDGQVFTQNPLDRSFNVVVKQIASRLFPTGFDVGPDAPDTFAKLRARLDSGARMLVWDGASDKTIFDCPETNYAFRAWHDWLHWKLGADFTPKGETAVMFGMQEHVRILYGAKPGHYQALPRGLSKPEDQNIRRWCAILEAEVIGQLEHKEDHGGFPEDQRGVTRRYLAVRGWDFAIAWAYT
jgi:hypothetical protein